MAGASYVSPGSSRPSPGSRRSDIESTRRPSGRVSTDTRWLPLHARCASQTSPCCSPKPVVPTAIVGIDSCDVRPLRVSRTSANGPSPCRVACSSCAQRPVSTIASAARAGSGTTGASESSVYASSPSLVSDVVIASTPCSSSVTTTVAVIIASGSVPVQVSPVAVADDAVRASIGTHAVPSARWPAMPPYAAQPRTCSGSSETGATLSRPPCGTGESSNVARAASSTSARRRPQWTTRGTSSSWVSRTVLVGECRACTREVTAQPCRTRAAPRTRTLGVRPLNVPAPGVDLGRSPAVVDLYS